MSVYETGSDVRMSSKVGARLGRQLRARREAQGLTQAVLAERADLTENYLSAVERGLKLPALDTLDRLAKVLGVEPGELLGLSTRDPWIEEVAAVAEGVPKNLRAVAIAVLRAVAQSRTGRR